MPHPFRQLTNMASILRGNAVKSKAVDRSVKSTKEAIAPLLTPIQGGFESLVQTGKFSSRVQVPQSQLSCLGLEHPACGRKCRRIPLGRSTRQISQSLTNCEEFCAAGKIPTHKRSKLYGRNSRCNTLNTYQCCVSREEWGTSGRPPNYRVSKVLAVHQCTWRGQ